MFVKDNPNRKNNFKRYISDNDFKNAFYNIRVMLNKEILKLIATELLTKQR